GGGTFDVSILKLSNGIFEVLSTNGDTYLGGDDIDRRLMELFISQIQRIVPEFIPDPEELQLIRQESVRAKICLSKDQNVTVDIPLARIDLNYKRNYSRTELEMLARPILDRTKQPCLDAMKDAKVTPRDIDEVVLVGGATRMPAIKALVLDLFKRKPHD